MRSAIALAWLVGAVQAIPLIERQDDPVQQALATIRADMPEYVEPQLNRDISDFLAIGDSFAAGISVGERLNYDCSRYSKAYPNQMHLDPRFPGPSTSRTFTFGACSGAKMKEVIDHQLKSGTPNSDDYTPIGKPQVATVSISGNDLGFGDIVENCLYRFKGWFAGDCKTAMKNAHALLDKPGRTFELEVVNVLSRIMSRGRNENENFQLFVTGYIRFWNEENTQCDDVSWGGEKLTTTFRKDMNSLVLKLNSQIKSAVDDLYREFKGVWFIDEFDAAFDGHRFCEVEADKEYHKKPIDARTWFIHWYTAYEVKGESLPDLETFEKQVNAALIPEKDGKSTEQQIEEVGGDLKQLNPAYENYDAMQAALIKLGKEDEVHALAPLAYIRVMHPTGPGYTAMSNAVLDKLLQVSATGSGGDDDLPGPGPGKPDEPEQGLKCSGVDTNTFIGRDDMNDKIGKFCAEAAAQKTQDKDSGSIMRRYNEGTRFEVDIGIDWPPGTDISENMEANCKDKMMLIMDACDGNDPKNPLNWKHGGTCGHGPAKYGIYPKIDQGYRPGSCSFSLNQDWSFKGEDTPGFQRYHTFWVKQLQIFGGDGTELVGRAGFKENSGDAARIECGAGDPFRWETALPDVMEITPQAQNDYIQFTIGGRAWPSSEKEGDKTCEVGEWSVPRNTLGFYTRGMKCSFPC